jgi:hypothetical protein
MQDLVAHSVGATLGCKIWQKCLIPDGLRMRRFDEANCDLWEKAQEIHAGTSLLEAQGPRRLSVRGWGKANEPRSNSCVFWSQ